MAEDQWSEVDAYLADRLIPGDPVLDAVLEANAAAGLPAIDVSAVQGKLLHLLARIARAERVLEIGTLGGYSTIWLARALPENGRVITCEVDPGHAEVARSNFRRASLSDRIDLRLGPALETLPKLLAEGGQPFDFVFIDADKPSNADYLSWALRLTRPGSVIVCDNIVRGGAVADADNADPRVQGARRFFDVVRGEPTLDAAAIQTVGAKGWDGFAIAVVR